MKRRISKVQEELGIRVEKSEEAPRSLSAVEAEWLNRQNEEGRGSRVERREPVPARSDLNLAELAKTGFWFCKACGKVVQLLKDPDLPDLPACCEFNTGHTEANGKVEWVPPVD